MKYYECPNCGLSIPDKGDTILRHKTFCKSSFENFSPGSLLTKSTLDSLSELLNVDINKIPKGIKIGKNKEGEIKITYKSTHLPWPLLGLIIFMIFFAWFQLKQEGRLGIPLWWFIIIVSLAAVYFLLSLLSNLIGRWEITLKNGKGTFFCGTGKYGQIKTFEYNRDSTVSAVTFRGPIHQPTASGSFIHMIYRSIDMLAFQFPPFLLLKLLALSKLPKEGIIVTTNGKPYIFGGSIYPAEYKKYIAACILRETIK